MKPKEISQKQAVGQQLITTEVWKRLRVAAENADDSARAAVAYFGQGAARLLPMSDGSKLVVDASEAAVKGGQTCPSELHKLHRRGVSIYRAANLHAKVFVFGSAAYIGSSNASTHSAKVLQEAVLRTDDPSAVRATRTFVDRLCLELLGPEELKRLQKLYRPPRFPGGRREARNRRPDSFPVLRVARVRQVDVSEDLERAFEIGLKEARKKRTRGRRFYIEEFYWSGHSPFGIGEMVIEVFQTPYGRSVSPPGHVIHTRRFGMKTLVYVEMPDDEWKPFSQLPVAVKSILNRGGQKNAGARQTLLGYWKN